MGNNCYGMGITVWQFCQLDSISEGYRALQWQKQQGLMVVMRAVGIFLLSFTSWVEWKRRGGNTKGITFVAWLCQVRGWGNASEMHFSTTILSSVLHSVSASPLFYSKFSQSYFHWCVVVHLLLCFGGRGQALGSLSSLILTSHISFSFSIISTSPLQQ